MKQSIERPLDPDLHSDAEIRARERAIKAWRLWLIGKSNSAIAKELGASRDVISRDILRIDQEIKGTYPDAFQIKVQHTAILQHMVSESMEEWSIGQTGRKNAKHLSNVLRALSDIRDIWIQKDVNKNDSEKTRVVDTITGLPDDLRRELIEKLAGDAHQGRTVGDAFGGEEDVS